MTTKKTEAEFVEERNEKMKKAANQVKRIRMLKDGKDKHGNKLTAGRVYEINDQVPDSLVKDELAEYVEGVERDPAHEGQSIIADPDMSQNENPHDATRPEPDMSRQRTLDTVGAKTPEELAAEEEEVDEEEDDPEQPGKKRVVKKKRKKKK